LRGALSFLSARSRLPWLDALLALAAGATAAYYILDYEGIASRQGIPATRDLVVGGALLVLLLEAARRAFGLALPTVAAAFIVYAFVGPYVPGVFSFAGVSLNALISQLTMSQAGVYGIPLRVSANTVFLFVLLGAMLEKTGGGRFFVQLAFSLLGRYRGGPAKAAVCASGLTGMVSGSSIANVVTTGTFTIPLMKKSGYPGEKAAAVEVAASTNGQLMPPIMGAAAFIIAEYCNTTYLKVVRAAVVPAVVSYLGLIYITHLEASKLGLAGLPAADLPRFFRVLGGGVHFLLPLATLIYLLLSGFSPSVAAFYAIAALAGLVVVRDAARFARDGLGAWRGARHAARLIGEALVTGAKGMMGVGVACAAAGIIVGIVGMGLGQRITEIVEVLSGGNILAILLLTAAASLILGMGLPTTATYIVMASLTATAIVRLWEPPAHLLAGVPEALRPEVIAAEKARVLLAAHLFCFYFGILADDTPPVGLAAYAGAAIARSNPIRTGVQGFVYDLRTAILPFMFFFNADLLLWGVRAWWHVAIVFAAATVAMCAFAALTQRYLVRKTRWWESGVLAASVFLLLRPGFVGDVLTTPSVHERIDFAPPVLTTNFLWYGIGSALFAGVYLVQRRDVARRATPQRSSSS
jgi:TRAP transporter 4TM/12TM fusion protein